MMLHAAFKEMNDGKKISRKSWGEGEYCWFNKDKNCLIHNRPYSNLQRAVDDNPLNGYYYILEGDDLIANDWSFVSQI